MHTPDVNHRYAGWRESVKLVSQMKAAAADLSEEFVSTGQQALDYETFVRTEFGEGGNDTIDDASSPIQRARVILVGHLQRSKA